VVFHDQRLVAERCGLPVLVALLTADALVILERRQRAFQVAPRVEDGGLAAERAGDAFIVAEFAAEALLFPIERHGAVQVALRVEDCGLSCYSDLQAGFYFSLAKFRIRFSRRGCQQLAARSSCSR